LIPGEKNMTTTSRKERVKLNASTENEEAPPPGKRTPNPALKQNKAAGAKSAESTASVKTSQSALENEKPRKPVRQAKVASEPAKAGAADKTVKTVKTIKADKSDTAGNIATASKKTKLRRDSYSIPESEHKHIAVLKKRCIDQGKPIKKSYLLRAGLQVLTLMDDDELLAAIARVK
jgi:hypothetical protein